MSAALSNDSTGELIRDPEEHPTTTRTPNLLLMNNGNGKFLDMSTQSGDGMRIRERSRSAEFDDLDNDGDLDVASLNAREGPALFRNDSPGSNHWIQIR